MSPIRRRPSNRRARPTNQGLSNADALSVATDVPPPAAPPITANKARGKTLQQQQIKELDQRVRDQHSYIGALIEANVDALIAFDPLGVITDVNKRSEEMTGCTRSELIGAPFKSYFAEPELAEAGVSRVLTDGAVKEYKLTAVSKAGKLTAVSCTGITFHDHTSTVQGGLAAARDLTEVNRLEQTLLRKNVELDDAGRVNTEFLARMSHELRTPLDAIVVFSAALRDGRLGNLTEEQKGVVADIFRSGKQVLAQINDALDLTTVEADTLELQLEPVYVASLFVSSLSVVREKAANRRIVLRMDADDELGSVQADARKVKQILYNLLSNAVKFTLEGGQVTLRARCVKRVDVESRPGAPTLRSFPLPVNEFAHFLEISVLDNGIGISTEGLAQLFKPFSQIDSGAARQFESTGRGLAMVKLLAELHGGSVAVDSAVGQGSCFTVWIPLRAVDSGAAGSGGGAGRCDSP